MIALERLISAIHLKKKCVGYEIFQIKSERISQFLVISFRSFDEFQVKIRILINYISLAFVRKMAKVLFEKF